MIWQRPSLAATLFVLLFFALFPRTTSREQIQDTTGNPGSTAPSSGPADAGRSSSIAQARASTAVRPQEPLQDVTQKVPVASQQRVIELYGQLPLSFEPNQGQSDSRVKFLARGGGQTLFLTASEAVLLLRQPAGAGHSPALGTKPEIDAVAPAVLRMKLVGANPMSSVAGLEELPGRSNYFLGDDRAKWRTDVPNFARVEYRDVYPGVSLAYYGNQRQLEYDFVLAPGADPAAISIGFEGADQIAMDADGNLSLHTAAGEVLQHAPVIYQEIDGSRQPIRGHYVLLGKSQFGFAVADYDSSQALIIDPLVVSYSTFLGGRFDDFGRTIAVDSSGNMYVAGTTDSANFPTANAFQPSCRLGGFTGSDCVDIFITKINAAGNAFVFSTFLGSTSSDGAGGMAVDAAGNVYLTGWTSSSNFPLANALDSTLGGNSDAFVVKLNTAGNALVYSTYLGGFATTIGGGSGDSGHAIAVDAAGNAYVAGDTDSTNFPTVNPVQPAKGADACQTEACPDAFVTKISPTGSAILYSTFLGGNDQDVANAIALDSTGSAYITGRTSSCNFPTTSGAYRSVCDRFTGSDIFVAKLSPSGSALVYSTYVAGSGGEEAYAIAVDAAGNAYIGGQVFSLNFPTVNAFQSAKVLPNLIGTGFVAKLNATGSALVYSSFLGGSDESTVNGIAVDGAGNAYLVGYTKAWDFPTAGGLRSNRVGREDIFVAKISPSGSGLAYSTFLGGNAFETGTAIAVDAAGNAYVTGLTQSANFPSVNGVQPTHAGPCLSGSACAYADDVFVTRLTQVVPDNFADAATIQTPIPVGDTVATTSATTETGDPTPACGNGSRAKSIWYRFVAPGDGVVTVDSLGSSYDTVLSAWTGAPDSFREIACNDNTAPATQSRVTFPVTSGSVYSLMVSAATGDGGTAVFNLRFDFPVPRHDNYVNATVVTSPFFEIVNTRAATSESNDPTPSCAATSFFPRSKSVWYRYTAPASALVTVNTIHSGYDTILSVWTGSPGAFTEVACNDDAFVTLQSNLSFSATAGTTYYFLITAFNNDGGKLLFQREVPTVPANDNFANAVNISGPAFSHTVNTRLATAETNEPRPSCGSGSRGHTVWYSFTAPSATPLVVHTFGSHYDTVLSIWTGSPGSLTQFACNDDAGTTTLQSSISFTTTAGTTYYFVVSPFVNLAGTNIAHRDGGMMTFNLYFGPPLANTAATGAQPVSNTPATFAESTIPATLYLGGPVANCGNSDGFNSVWFRYTPTANTPVTADTIGSSYDTVLSVWTGPATTLTQVACNDDATGLQSRVSFPAIAGTDYYFLINATNRDGGTLFFNLALQDAPIPSPANETPSEATSITGATFSGSVDTRFASSDTSDPTPACGNGSRAKSVWYRFTAPAVGTVVADTFGSGYNTLLSVWTGSPGSFTPVACNDDAVGLQSQVSFVAAGGTTYFFMVSAVNNDGGTLVFNLSFFQGVTNPIPTANFLTFVPHSAFGGGFLTRLYLANLVTSTNAVTVNRINQNGQLVGSTSATLAVLGTLLIANPESQRTQSLTMQWFAIGSERPISASVLFDCCASGPEVVSAVGVLGQAAGTAFTAPFLFQREVAGSQPLLEEGMAIANRADSANQVTIRLLDSNGVQLSSDPLTPVPAFGQTAFTVSELPNVSGQLAARNTLLGSLEITGTQPFASVYVGNLGGRLFSLPIAASDQVPAGAAVTAIPHFVTGGGYVTRLFVRNLAAVNNNLTIQFIGQSGSSTSSEMPSLATGQTIERTSGEANRSAQQSTQWIAINSTGATSASVLFDCCDSGSSVTSAVGVLGQAAGTSFIAPFIFQRQTASQPILVQGLGIANRSQSANTITIRVLDQNGSQISSDVLPAFPAMGQTAFTVSDLPNLSVQLQGRETFLGLLEITGTQPFAPVYVGNLGGRLFSLPLTAQ